MAALGSCLSNGLHPLVGNSLENEKKNVTVGSLLRTAWSTARATARPTLLIVFVGMIAPQVVLAVLFDRASDGVVHELRRAFAARATAGVAGTFGNFQELVAPALSYVGPLVAYSFGMLLVVMASYFALVHIAVGAHRAEPLPRARDAFFQGLRSTVPNGIIVMFCLTMLAFVGQVLVAPALLVAVLSLVIPVILVAERKGAFAALGDALLLRYARRAEFSGWQVLFMLLSLGAAFYTLVAVIGLGTEQILRLDETLGLPRGVWAPGPEGSPIGPMYLLVTVIEVTSTMLLLGFYPSVTAALYFAVVGRRKVAEA